MELKKIARFVIVSLCFYSLTLIISLEYNSPIIGSFTQKATHLLKSFYLVGYEGLTNMTMANCSPLRFPGFGQSENMDWQNGTTSGNAFVYSAFRVNDIIRVIGVNEKWNDSTFFCQIWTRSEKRGVSLTTTEATVVYLPHHHKKR